MPLSRHTVGNEYALGGRDLYRAADQHDPEAVLDGVAMAGLVGILRQLGDLAEFSAQVFHGLYDDVMSTSARGHGLMLRVQQLEAEVPLLEKDSCQRDYLHVASDRGVDWHPNARVDQGVVSRGDTPRFIMESIKQCRGPPKLFMLDKYDIGGEGACLKRYTDPSFFKTDSACSTMLQEGIQKERIPLKALEIRPNLQNAEIFQTPNTAGTVSRPETDPSGEPMDEVPINRRRLKYRQLNGSVFQRFRPLMQDLYEKASSEEKVVTIGDSKVHIPLTDSPESNTEERDIMVDTSVNMDKAKVTVRKNRTISEEALSRSSDARSAGSSKGYNSEVDIYMDALTTMDSEVETDSEHRGYGHRIFARVDSDNTFSDDQNAMASRSSSFEKKDSSHVTSANKDMGNQHEDDTVSTQQTKPVVGEHERTRSLEELLEQEKPLSWDHERTSSLEELLTEDFHASESGVGEQDTEEPSCNGSVTSVVSNDTQDITKKTKEVKDNSKIATISFKKISSKRSKYVGGMELIASKVGILQRKLSKKHDPFSDSLRSMAKQLLELKYDGTQDSDLYDFEANGEGCDVNYLEMQDPTVEFKESAVPKIPSDSPHDDVGSRKCMQEEVNHETEHDVPPTDSPHDSNPDDGNGFQDSNIVYLTGIITSPSPQEEEGSASTAPDEHSSSGVLNHILEHAQEKIEEHPDREVTEHTHTEVISENASDTCEDLKEVSNYREQVNAEDIDESNISDAYALDDETAEYIEERAVSDGMVSSPVSSKQSDHPCWITPLILVDEDDPLEYKVTDSCNPEVEHITSSEEFADTGLPKVVTESAINCKEVADNEQYYLNPETTFGQGSVLGSDDIAGQNGQVPLCSSTTVAVAPELTTSTEPKHELHKTVHQNPLNSFNSSTEGFEDPLGPDSRCVPSPIISSFDWMLNGAMQQSLNIVPAHPTYGNAQNCTSEDAPPLPPLPPMQWRTNKLQTGSSPLSAKIGRPPRPKPPVKQRESEDGRILQENSLHKCLSMQNEIVEATVSSDHEINQFLNMESHENYHQTKEEYDSQYSNPFSSSEGERVAEVDSVKSENMHSMQLPELIVVPEEAWSEFGNIEFIKEQEGINQLSNGASGFNGLNTSGLSAQKTNDKHEKYFNEERVFSPAGGDKIADFEENKPNDALEQDSMLNLDLTAQHKDDEHGVSNDKTKEFSSALEEDLARSPTHPVPKPPRYPLLPVTFHDRSMLRKASTLVQPSSKLSDENTLLEQIKNKSSNLKPVLAKRPNVMGGPRTNLQVVAILERAHAIRQAVADDDDEDSWSE